MHNVAVYLVQRLYRGPEEGGWFYVAGELCTDPRLIACGNTFPDGHESLAVRFSEQVQQHLDRVWNIGDHARSLGSVLSTGRYEAQVHDGWPPAAYPAEPPRYE